MIPNIYVLIAASLLAIIIGILIGLVYEIQCDRELWDHLKILYSKKLYILKTKLKFNKK